MLCFWTQEAGRRGCRFCPRAINVIIQSWTTHELFPWYSSYCLHSAVQFGIEAIWRPRLPLESIKPTRRIWCGEKYARATDVPQNIYCPAPGFYAAFDLFRPVSIYRHLTLLDIPVFPRIPSQPLLPPSPPFSSYSLSRYILYHPFCILVLRAFLRSLGTDRSTPVPVHGLWSLSYHTTVGRLGVL